MRKLVLAFAAGAIAGWLVRVAAEPRDAVAPSQAEASAHANGGSAPAAPSPRPRRESSVSAPAAPSTAAAPAPNVAAPAPRADTDEETLALLEKPDSGSRERGILRAAERHLLSVSQLLDRSRSDPDFEVRAAALAAALGLACDDEGAMDVVAPEVVACIDDADDEKRSFGLEHLDDIGAHGAAVGRELLDEGGLPPELYDSAVSTLVEARRFERLVPEDIEDASRRHLQTRLAEALDGDDALAPRVAEVLRQSGAPHESDALTEFVELALRAHAPDILRDLADSKSAPAAARVRAADALLENLDEAGVRIAERLLTDADSPPSLRRRFLDGFGGELAGRDEAGLAVMRRVADHDENPWIRRHAAEILSGAGY